LQFKKTSTKDAVRKVGPTFGTHLLCYLLRQGIELINGINVLNLFSAVVMWAEVEPANSVEIL
jgi:hypothetical protein